MAITLGFDVYGTLIDTHGLVPVLRDLVGDRAEAFSQAWRDKQLEYAFRRGLMEEYVDFGVCTRQALQFTCASFGIEFDEEQVQDLIGRYRRLPAFADVRDGLSKLREYDFRLYAFSNGTEAAVASLLDAAQIRDLFIDILSVDDIASFKPDPAVYNHFLSRTGASGTDAWLISSNPFDVIGAVSAGMRAAWLQRSPDAVFDPWEIEPSITVNSLDSLGEQISQYHGSI